MCGVTRMDRIGNEYVRESYDVTNLTGKMRENRFNGLDMLKKGIITI